MEHFDLLVIGGGPGGYLCAQRAAQGDAAQLTGAIRQLMNDPEGAKLIQKMKESLK